MRTLPENCRLVIATHNSGKIREIDNLLGPHDFSVVSAGDLGLPEPDETGKTFQENAILKARAAAIASGEIALADDSGLAVSALGGEPGIYSARWAGPEKDFHKAMKKVHDAIGDNPDRGGAFICVLALAWPDGYAQTFEGRVDGDIIWPPRGDKGFGYDPFFVPHGHSLTYAEIDLEAKRKISHRARAFDAMIRACCS